MSTITRIFPALLAAGALAAACGDLRSDPQPRFTSVPGSGPTIAFDGGSSAVVADDFVSSCPSHAPVDGQACSDLGVTCEIGSSPDAVCNTTFGCTEDPDIGRAWIARPSVLCPSYECPSGAAASIDGTPCDLPTVDGGAPTEADELVCAMTDAVCACTTGVDEAHKHARTWVCVKPTADCPSDRPRVGESCTAAKACDYGGCQFKRGMRMECKNDVWLTGTVQCN